MGGASKLALDARRDAGFLLQGVRDSTGQMRFGEERVAAAEAELGNQPEGASKLALDARHDAGFLLQGVRDSTGQMRFDEHFGGLTDEQVNAYAESLRQKDHRDSVRGRLEDLATASAILFPVGAPLRVGAMQGLRHFLTRQGVRPVVTRFTGQSALELGADVGVETIDRGLGGGSWVPSPQSFGANAPEAVAETVIERIIPGYRGRSRFRRFGSNVGVSTVSGGLAEAVAPDFIDSPEGPSFINQHVSLPNNDVLRGTASGFASGVIMASPGVFKGVHFPRTESGLTVVDADTALRIENNRLGQENANRIQAQLQASRTPISRRNMARIEQAFLKELREEGASEPFLLDPVTGTPRMSIVDRIPSLHRPVPTHAASSSMNYDVATAVDRAF